MIKVVIASTWTLCEESKLFLFSSNKYNNCKSMIFGMLEHFIMNQNKLLGEGIKIWKNPYMGTLREVVGRCPCGDDIFY